MYDDDSLLSLVQSDFALKFTRIDHGLADEARLIGPTANDRPGPGQWEESRAEEAGKPYRHQSTHRRLGQARAFVIPGPQALVDSS